MPRVRPDSPPLKSPASAAAGRGRPPTRRRAIRLALAALGTAAAPGGAPAQVAALPPFAFATPPGFARAAGAGESAMVLRDGDGAEIVAQLYPGPHPLLGRTPAEVTAALGDTLASALLSVGYAWLEAPSTTRRADGVLLFRALAARPMPPAAQAFQFVVYAIAPNASLHIGYTGIGAPAAARAAIDAVAASLRYAPA